MRILVDGKSVEIGQDLPKTACPKGWCTVKVTNATIQGAEKVVAILTPEVQKGDEQCIHMDTYTGCNSDPKRTGCHLKDHSDPFSIKGDSKVIQFKPQGDYALMPILVIKSN